MMILYETRYTGWTVQHFQERWHTEHGGAGSSSWTKKTLQAAGACGPGSTPWGPS